MNLNFNFFNILILAGCVQGMILGVLLLLPAKRSRSRVFLGILLIAYSLNNLNAVFVDTTLSFHYPALLICPFSLIFLIGPALYLHTRFTLSPDSPFKRIHLLHFLPAAIELLWYLSLSLLFLNNPSGIRSFYNQYETWYSLPEQTGGIISVFIYLRLSLLLLKMHKQQLKNTYSAIEDLEYKSLRVLVKFLALGWATWLLLVMTDVTFYRFNLDQHVYYPLYIIMSITIYAIGYSGYFGKVIVLPANELQVQKTPTVSVGEEPELQHIADRLQKWMEQDKAYLDPMLRQKTAAGAIACSPQKLSAALNSVLQKNFYDFVNEYRVAEVRAKLASTANNHLTLTAIAYESGFNSKSAFNENFRKITGKTPNEYKTSIQNNVQTITQDVSVKESA